MGTDTECSGRWNHIRRLLERGGPFAHPDFEPSSDNLTFIQETCRILVIGAGGLGCELLKNLALLGFRDVHVIDMDTIDVSNLNRQFLFRPKDVGSSKADVAARFINTRVPGCKVTPHHAKIQDFDESFYRGFHIVVCGLDSIVARRWINGMLFSLLKYENGEVDQTSVIPLVDGGTEGLKGNARVILPGITACIECTLDLYPPQINFPLCTIAHTPRLPEHCIEYARILLWPKEEPFGAGVAIDGDNPLHVSWIMKKAEERAEEYGITGITYRLTQGVVKRIIPAVASTNAVIAAACATEVFKLATSCCQPLNNYMNFNDIEGVYTYTFEAQKREDCLGVLQPQALCFCEEDKLQDVITYLTESTVYQMKSPGITTSIDGKNRTLYMQTVKSIEEKTRGNLKKTLKELGLTSGQELYVADITTPSSLIFRLALSTSMDTSAENSLNAAN
ncbi:LOW QUALITY PROTEIN: NEDD8-activating enzyme E1 catalytic subunit-like [Pomacea canaliculata]|uniref:LOW QUALITY PROTEIN: NEDD8-activating enzyme E1 catalytic subunit-like n=1 Tax=Pomacea canaliculata TaxID=400727 RepID=UPI000D72EAEE|nr:LOW QUALITY PROTEIN: NEDD8-activating enzyme E1 catalytic subunit-like [Pomacea canaliculata]